MPKCLRVLWDPPVMLSKHQFSISFSQLLCSHEHRTLSTVSFPFASDANYNAFSLMSTVWGFQDMQIHTHAHTPSTPPQTHTHTQTQNSCRGQELLKRRAINQMERSYCIPSQSLCFSPAIPIPLWENLIVPEFAW